MERTFHIERARQLKVCLIIPTYNNSKTLRRVIDGALNYIADIIVVNDGSTDETASILTGYNNIILISHSQNRGKGYALRSGFREALQRGFDYAITIDSDGQHFPADIPLFLDALEKNGPVLLIGNRDMTQAGVPGKSSFGNKFSNFWFKVETGISLDDTQSGFRLYPLQLLPQKFYTKKFEFEIEVIVRSAWRGVPIINIPIQVLYDADERVSHFRPFRDFTRISILNTILVLNTFLYIKPREIIRNFKRKGFRRFVTENILQSEESNLKKALSIGLGIFVGIAPIWGVQTVVVLFLAAVLKLNKAIAFTFSNISMPPLVPFIIYVSLIIGNYIIPSESPVTIQNIMSFDDLGKNFGQYLLGSIILATAMATAFTIIGYVLLTTFKPRQNSL
jgi:glycosyltransferase involved in cell wall biosynthesis